MSEGMSGSRIEDGGQEDGEWEEFEEEYFVLAEMEGLDAALMQQDLSYSLVVCITR